MATDLLRGDFAEQVLNNQFMHGDNIGGATLTPSDATFTRPRSTSSDSNKMATDLLRGDFAEQVLNNQFMHGDNIGGATLTPSGATFTRPRSTSSDSNKENSSSYTLASEDSQCIDSSSGTIWRQATSTESTGVQNSRAAVVQRSTLAPTSSLETNGMWYIMAMILPLFSYNNGFPWRCSPSTVLSAAELLLAQLSTLCGRARDQLRRMAQDQNARDLFATAMDVVLVVYAIGFLVLSLYQAAIIG